MDIFGQALLDFQKGNYTEDIVTYSSLEEEDIMPLPYLFRNFEEMPFLEQRALNLAAGRVLDVGCGAGNHCLYLQEKGFDVLGLDSSEGAIAVCLQRGVKGTLNADFFGFSKGQFDTLLFMMNGIGIVGKLQRLPQFLDHCRSILNPNGQILLDSSNIIYMFEQDEDGGYFIPGNQDYYGEVEFQMAYKNKKGPIFDWLYLDFITLKHIAESKNFDCELICEGEHYDYLARLSPKRILDH